MTKLSAESDDLLYEGDYLTIRAMKTSAGGLPAKEWLNGLEERYRVKFGVAAEQLEVDLRDNRNSGRTELVPQSEMRLNEYRITRPGSRPPHLRMLGLREGNTVWMAHGFKKQTNQLRARDIRKADNVAKDWKANQGPGSK